MFFSKNIFLGLFVVACGPPPKPFFHDVTGIWADFGHFFDTPKGWGARERPSDRKSKNRSVTQWGYLWTKYIPKMSRIRAVVRSPTRSGESSSIFRAPPLGFLVKPSFFDDFCESHPERVGVYITSPILLPLHTNQLHDDTHWLTEAIRDILRCLRDVLPQGYPFADPRYSLFSQNRRSLAKSNCRTTRYPTVVDVCHPMISRF